MPAPIEFWFDFASPYGYIASERIEAIAARHGREVRWRPFLLGAAFKKTGGVAPVQVPLKGEYYQIDFPRSARFHGVAYRKPSHFPIASVSATRAFYWLDTVDPARAKDLARALYRAYFVEDLDISDAENVVAVCAKLGIDADAARAGISDPQVKERTRAEVDRGVALGAFGSPYIVIDGEPFWGADRLDQIERWLASGGF